MNSIASVQSAAVSSTAASAASVQNAASHLLTQSTGHGANQDLKSAFTDFTAGTFYKEMLKSLHKMHGKPAYLHGGKTEELFQGQLDQQISEDLAHKRGSALADSLYQAFLRSGRV